MGADQSIQSFWNWFEANESALYEATGRKNGVWDAIWDEVPEQLHQVDERLWFEVSHPDGGVREFIVTAQGNVEAFGLVEALIAAAPEMPGWKMIALKPAMGFDFKTDYEGMHFDLKEMWFMPFSSPQNPEAAGLEIGIPEFNPERSTDTMNAVLMMLDTALGEREAARDIDRVEISLLPSSPESLGYIEVPKLPEYLASRKPKTELA